LEGIVSGHPFSLNPRLQWRCSTLFADGLAAEAPLPGDLDHPVDAGGRTGDVHRLMGRHQRARQGIYAGWTLVNVG